MASINVYSRTANGSAVPLRSFLDVSRADAAAGVAVDAVHDEILVANGGSISVYSRTASGLVSPLRTISGSATGLEGGALSVALDLVNDEVLALAYPNTITAYPRTADGNVAPVRTLSGVVANLSQPSFAVDPTHHEIAVADDQKNTVSVYARTASGNNGPLRTILSGDSSAIATPYGIAADTAHDEIFVSNAAISTITVYSRFHRRDSHGRQRGGRARAHSDGRRHSTANDF